MNAAGLRPVERKRTAELFGAGVAAVPGSSFYKTDAGRTKLRFCFCKKDETLQEADRRLLKLVPAGVTLH